MTGRDSGQRSSCPRRLFPKIPAGFSWPVLRARQRKPPAAAGCSRHLFERLDAGKDFFRQRGEFLPFVLFPADGAHQHPRLRLHQRHGDRPGLVIALAFAADEVGFYAVQIVSARFPAGDEIIDLFGQRVAVRFQGREQISYFGQDLQDAKRIAVRSVGIQGGFLLFAVDFPIVGQPERNTAGLEYKIFGVRNSAQGNQQKNKRRMENVFFIGPGSFSCSHS